MTEPRLPASPQGAAEGGIDEEVLPAQVSTEGGATEWVDRSKMLPRLHGVEVDESDEELALLLAEQFYPDLTHIDQIQDKQEKRNWTVLTVQILRGQEAVIRYAAETFGKVFQPSVDAQVADTLRKGAAEELEREERKAREIEIQKASLFRIAQEECLDIERWELEKKEREKKLELEENERITKLRLEEEERKTALTNRDRREKLVIGMALVTFVCALAAFIVGLVSKEPWIIGGSGITGVAALATFVKLLSDEIKTPPTPAGGEPASAP
jgi:hypothetical protein